MRLRPANWGCHDGRPEVVATARPVLDLDGRTGHRGLDSLLEFVGGRHLSDSVEGRYT